MTSPQPTSSSRRARRLTAIASVLSISLGVGLLLPTTASAAPPIGLGTATSFAVLAGSGITNTGPTTVTGDIGSFPNPSETGLSTMVQTGVDHAGDAVTQQAKIDLETAYGVAAGATPPTSVATELGGLTLLPGVYNGATLEITGTLTLDTQGDPDAVFVFQTPSTLITAPGSAVVVLNGVQACNVYWQVGSSATLGTGSTLVGTVLARTSITANTAATVQGRLLALDGAVTLDTNTITNDGCATVPTTTSSSTSSTTVSSTTSTTVASTTSTTTPTSTTATTAPTPVTTTPTTTPTGSTPSLPEVSPAAPGAPSTPGSPSRSTSDSERRVDTPTGRPALPFTGSDPRVPAVGALLVMLGVLLLVASTRGTDRRRAS
jgi:hypothetical protein